MTRQQIKAAVATLLHEDLGAPGSSTPFSLNMWIDQVTDTLCADTDANYGTVSANIVSGQSLYCIPQIYKIKAAYYIDPTSLNKVMLVPITPYDMDRRSSGWRNDISSLPTYYATQGINSLVLYPTPNFAGTADLLVEGFLVPGQTWEADSAVCPLPTEFHMAVVWGVCELRTLETQNPANLKLLENYKSQYADLSGKLERQMHALTDATRHADLIVGSISSGFDPLDQR